MFYLQENICYRFRCLTSIQLSCLFLLLLKEGHSCTPKPDVWLTAAESLLHTIEFTKFRGTPWGQYLLVSHISIKITVVADTDFFYDMIYKSIILGSTGPRAKKCPEGQKIKGDKWVCFKSDRRIPSNLTLPKVKRKKWNFT